MVDAPQGATMGLTPHITIAGNRAAEAIAFYVAAFGATEHERLLADDGQRLMHADVLINGGLLMLNDDFPEYHGPADVGAGPPSGVTLHLQVDDADAWFARAVQAGARVKMPLADQFWGDRYGQVVDPFGYVWSIGAPIAQ
ncbi:glyoxalase/bleomycin resistance/extradiol dioxygenase family protein [Sphingomonas sp. 28-63-12]|uniref:VOC family protein n=1 Tax=Sphingomonas sp. 28-63-12 TaxID=1970434 RepID=UPI000BC5C8E7|nr:MAG: glyoxalase [Sphingomonas sp. 28-63-12]